MSRFDIRFVLAVGLIQSVALAQQGSSPAKTPPPNQPAPHSDSRPVLKPRPTGEQSSSKETPPDLTPPQNDAKDHPESGSALHEAEDAAGLHEGDEIGGVQEVRVWNPHKAAKDVEVGDFYFKRKNYRAALSRYQEALYYKYDDAVATFRLAVCQEKLGESEEARKAYEAYLKILPHGPFAAEAQLALGHLKPSEQADTPKPAPPR